MNTGLMNEVLNFTLDDGSVFEVRKKENKLYIIPNEEIIKTATQLRSLANAQLKSRLERLNFLKKSQEHLAILNGALPVLQTADDACRLSEKIVSQIYSLSLAEKGGPCDILITEWLYILKFFHLPLYLGSQKIKG